MSLLGLLVWTDTLIRRCTEVQNTACAYRLYVLVLYYRTAMRFNLNVILREVDLLQEEGQNDSSRCVPQILVQVYDPYTVLTCHN